MPADPRRALQPEDLYDLSSPGEPHFSPDGSTLLHVVARVDRATDGYRADLHVVALDGGSGRSLVSGRGRLRRPMFAPTGDRIAYIDVGVGGSAQIWLVGPSGAGPSS